MAINLGFTNGELTSVDASAPWYASYFLNGDYELSTAESAGHYTVTNAGLSGWTTAVDTASFQSLYSTNEFLVFSDPPVSGATGTPETSTWLMLIMGFGIIAYKALDKRAKRANIVVHGD